MNVFGRMIVKASPRRPKSRVTSSASIFDSPYQPTPTSGSSSKIGCTSGTP